MLFRKEKPPDLRNDRGLPGHICQTGLGNFRGLGAVRLACVVRGEPLKLFSAPELANCRPWW
jgi:hypothetical protein